MKWQWIKELIILHLVCISVLALFLSFIGCNVVSAVGPQVQPNNKHYSTIFNEIYDQDSVVHWYTSIYNGTNWCYYHHQYEEVKSVR